MSTRLHVVPAARTGAPPVPQAVVLSTALWIGAILAGFTEALVRLAGPLPPGGAELAGRAVVYLVLGVLVLQLRTGRDTYRWTVVGVLGVLGTASLVVGPLRALAAGGSATAFLATATGPEVVAAGLRTLHVAEVLAAVGLLFGPAARAFFGGTATQYS
ncbi:hypothetical protein [Pseudonocardia spirodelae]|uniref:Uncharacterized protein n=1 Tax=Pseudonocardia spirodelae TaxID=3133431 RepID=A0ABU8T2R4_9PSEU